MQTWNVNVEREFGGTGVMVGYFGSHGDRQRIPINLNQFVTPGGTDASVRQALGGEPDPAGTRRSATSRNRRASARPTTRGSG